MKSQLSVGAVTPRIETTRAIIPHNGIAVAVKLPSAAPATQVPVTFSKIIFPVCHLMCSFVTVIVPAINLL